MQILLPSTGSRGWLLGRQAGRQVGVCWVGRQLYVHNTHTQRSSASLSTRRSADARDLGPGGSGARYSEGPGRRKGVRGARAGAAIAWQAGSDSRFVRSWESVVRHFHFVVQQENACTVSGAFPGSRGWFDKLMLREVSSTAEPKVSLSETSSYRKSGWHGVPFGASNSVKVAYWIMRG